MIQASITAKRGFEKRVKGAIEDQLGEKLKDLSFSIVKDIGSLTPTVKGSPVGVDAEFSIGAYANSHSFSVNNTSSRGRRVKGSTSPRDAKARQRSGNVYDPQRGIQKLYQDVASSDFTDVDSMTFRNDSEHAQDVESKYKVYTQAGLRADRRGL